MQQFPSFKYNFAYLCSVLRFIQISCTVVNVSHSHYYSTPMVIQMVLIFLESGNLSYIWFGIYMALCGLYLHHVLRKWFFNIDGRYDLQRMVSEEQATACIQYAVASFSACLLSWPMWCVVELENSYGYAVSYLCGLLSVSCAHLLLSVEVYETFTRKDKQ